MKHATMALLVAAILSCTAAAMAKTHKVSSDQQLYLASRSVNPGDVVEIEGAKTYRGRLFFERSGTSKHPIILRGILKNGKRPIIHGGDDTITINAAHYIVDSIEFTGGSVRCIFVYGNNIVLRNLSIHDCNGHGILSADDDSGNLFIDHCEVYRTGRGDRMHQIYVTSDQFKHPGSVFRLQYSYLHDANGGNNVKSRAERNEIYFNWIEGARYHELELIGPDVDNPPAIREDSDIVGNVLWNTNPEAHATRFGGDNTMDTNGRYRLAFNTIVMASNNRSPLRLFDGVESLELYNNLFVSSKGGGFPFLRTARVRWTRGKPLIIGSHNYIPKHASGVPPQLTHTLSSDDPQLVNLAAFDPRPKSSSPLVGAGTAALTTQPDAPFPRPLSAAAFQPPLRRIGPAKGRALASRTTIGAMAALGPEQPHGATPPASGNPLPAPLPSHAPAVDTPRQRSPAPAIRSRCQCDMPTGGGAHWWWVVALGIIGLGRRSQSPYRRQPSVNRWWFPAPNAPSSNDKKFSAPASNDKKFSGQNPRSET